MFALFVAYFLYGVTQAKVSQRPPISINKLRGLDDSSDDSSDDEDVGIVVLDHEFDHLDRACKVHATNLVGQTVEAKVV